MGLSWGAPLGAVPQGERPLGRAGTGENYFRRFGASNRVTITAYEVNRALPVLTGHCLPRQAFPIVHSDAVRNCILGDTRDNRGYKNGPGS